MTLRQIVRGLKEPRKILMYLLLKTAKMWSDEQFLKMLFPLRTGYKLNLKNPQTFNEKLQWLKLNNRKPEMVKMVDKVEAKEYVANIIGEEYIIPTLGVYNSVDEIDFDKLPNQFVLKCTHDSGGIVICSDKSKLDIDAAKAKLARGLKVNYYYQNREWPYKQVKPRIIAEQYMTDGMSNDLPDYKFFCFDGEPEYCQVIRDRHTKETIDFYDMQWNQMPFIGLNPVAGNGLTPVAKPTHLDKMIEICRKLSDGNPFSRIDLYVINNKEYFGEITFYPMSGMGKFTPGEWNNRLGDLINLPTPIGGGKYSCLIHNGILEFVKEEEELKDYKLFCFDGKVEFLFIASDRNSKTEETKFDFFDTEFNHLPFLNGHPNSTKKIIKPVNFDKMIELAEKLAVNHPHLRVDFYNVNGKIYFGELTFYHWSGMTPFEPIEWDYKFGELIKLPKA